jgi:hypothetical protein
MSAEASRTRSRPKPRASDRSRWREKECGGTRSSRGTGGSAAKDQSFLPHHGRLLLRWYWSTAGAGCSHQSAPCSTRWGSLLRHPIRRRAHAQRCHRSQADVSGARHRLPGRPVVDHGQHPTANEPGTDAPGGPQCLAYESTFPPTAANPRRCKQRHSPRP